MSQVINETDTQWLVVVDGQTETRTKASDYNQLLYQHNLGGLLERGDEIWRAEGTEGEPTVNVYPEGGEEFTLDVGKGRPLTLGSHHKTDLISAIADYYEQESESITPFVRLYDRIRGNMVRDKIVAHFAPLLGSRIEVRDNGWFINGHVLLTFEGEVYHPDHKSRNRQGRIVGTGTSIEAYQYRMPDPDPDMHRSVTVEGTGYRLTEAEMSFVTKAMWLVENTPDRR